MRLPYALFGVSLAVFGTALAAPRQEKTAEQQFKNIISFKGAKAGDIVPAMEFMGGSLGVGCDYCHVADRSSDEKKKKITAREMIDMQRGINEKYFGGRNQVTCASCHNGHTHPVSVPPIEGMEIRAHRSGDVAPEEVLAAYSKATGRPAPAGLKVSGTATERGQKSTFEITYAGGKFSMATHGPRGDVKQGFNGSLIWYTAGTTTNKVPLEYAEQFVREYEIFLGPDSLPKLTNPGGATAKIGDRDAVVVSGTIDGEKTRASFFFDKQSGLLVRAMYSYPTILGNIAQVDEYSDYKKVDGVEVPMTVTSHSTNGDAVLSFTSANAVAHVDPGIFEPTK